MKKKGFTLVELLAVIAILAILIIIALPNVLKMFRNAKQNTFTTEVQNLVRSAENKYLTDSMNNVINTCFDSKTNPLDMTGRDNLIYKIKLSDKGQLLEVSVVDEEYQIIANNSNGITREELGKNYKVETLKEDTTIVGCDNTALKGEYIDKKLIIKKDNEEIQSIQMGKNTTTIIEKEADFDIISCNNGIEVSEANGQIKLDNVQVDNSVCNFSNDISSQINNSEDTQNNILLLNDLTLEELITINIGKQITIDTNGKSINSSISSRLINNNSNLTIKNSSDNESSIMTPRSIVVNNENAILNLDNIKIISSEASSIANYGKLIVKNCYIEGPNGIGYNDTANATFDIYDSEIVGTTNNGINLNPNSLGSGGNIHSSTITGKNNAINSDSNGTINIYSGTYTGQNTNGIRNGSTGTINICSGEINGATNDLNNISTGTINYTSKVTLKNGTTNGTNINLTDGITCE